MFRLFKGPYFVVGHEAHEVYILYGHLLETGCMYALSLIRGHFIVLELMYFVILSASQILLTSAGQTCET